METLASLIDKLAIVNIKYSLFQTEVNKQKAEGKCFCENQKKIDKLNQQRNALTQELDELYRDNLTGKKEIKTFEHLRFHDHDKVGKK